MPSATAADATSPSRRYVLVDIENLIAGRATCTEAAALWSAIAQETPGITANDHVVIGGSRYTARKFSTTITGGNVKWVVGADGPNGADRALLAAINVHQVAKRYDELIIMSGDHAFTDLAVLGSRLGLRIHAVATTRGGATSMSRRLAAAADVTTEVDLGRTAPYAGTAKRNPAA